MDQLSLTSKNLEQCKNETGYHSLVCSKLKLELVVSYLFRPLRSNFKPCVSYLD